MIKRSVNHDLADCFGTSMEPGPQPGTNTVENIESRLSVAGTIESRKHRSLVRRIDQALGGSPRTSLTLLRVVKSRKNLPSKIADTEKEEWTWRLNPISLNSRRVD